MRLCIVIPAHNEARTIARIVTGVKTHGLDVVVVDDGSIDDSGKLARQAGAEVLRNDVKTGKGGSLRRAFGHVLGKGYEGVITMDADGQHAVEDLNHFLKKISEDPDSVITGNRMNNAGQMPLVRRLTNRLMSGLISSICKQAVPDTQCGYRYISIRVLKTIRLTSKDYEIETEVLIQASRRGFRIHSVPIQTIYQNEESKISPLKDTFRFIAYLARELMSSSR